MTAVINLLLLLCVAVNSVQAAQPNLALNKNAFQTSVYKADKAKFGPRTAVDGKVPKSCSNGGCAITNNEYNPWWAVDLGAAHDVGVVKLTNRPDFFGWRSNHFVVGLTNTDPMKLRPNLKNYQVCGEYKGTLLRGQTATVTCKPSSFKARYVIVQFPMKDTMNFAEVEVYARAACKPTFGPPQLNTNVRGGTHAKTGDASLDACKRACVREETCTAIDWDPDQPRGQKCWLIIGEKPTKTEKGVTHYAINRRGSCEPGSKVPDTKSGSGGGGSGGGSGAGSKTCNNTKCPAGFTYVGSVSGCYKVIMENKNWIEAGRSCRAAHADAHLLVIDNVAEQLAIKEFMTGKQFGNCLRSYGGNTFFTAGQRVKPGDKTDFVWRIQSTDGCSDRVSRIDYSSWKRRQPNFGGNSESCLSVAKDFGYEWNDVSCSRAMCSVCEIDI